MFNGRRQPSRGGTSRMMREYQVRFCERLGVKFPGPTRHGLKNTRQTERIRRTLNCGRNRKGSALTLSARRRHTANRPAVNTS
jgi:hypothetical protein